MQWLRALCVEGRLVPVAHAAEPGPPQGFDAARFRRGQRVALAHLFSLAYAELVSMLMMFAFEDQTDVLAGTGRSDTPAKAYIRYLSTMRRVRTWYEGDLWDPESEAAKNLKVVRNMHRLADTPRPLGAATTTLHARAAGAAGLACPVVTNAAREAFAGHAASSHPWADDEGCEPREPCERAPALSQRAMAVTQVAFLGLFILEPELFGAHGVAEADLDALVYVWWVLGRALGVQDRFNACGTGDAASSVRVARARCGAVVRTCALPRLARASARWQLMSAALCDGAALAAPGLSLPLALSCLGDALEAVARRQRPSCSAPSPHDQQGLRGLLSARDRAWRAVYRLVLDRAMRYGPGRAFHNALFRLSLWVSARVPPHWVERVAPQAQHGLLLLSVHPPQELSEEGCGSEESNLP